MKRALGVILASALLVGIGAQAKGETRQDRYPATLKCSGMAEDSAGHVRLVQFKHNDDGSYTIVYHCLHAGY